MPELLKLETSTETSYVNFVSKEGCDAIKINKRGWPDRLTVLNNGYSFYIEFKRCVKTSGLRQGEKYQNYIHKTLRARGFHVYLIDDIKEAKKIFKYELFFRKQISELMYTPKELVL